MPWVRLDESAPTHPKTIGLSDAAFALWVRSICYANLHLTDGVIPRSAIRSLTRARRPMAVAAELVTAGLWDIGETLAGSIPAPSGTLAGSIPAPFVLHDYAFYQPTRAHVLAERSVGAERKKAARARAKSPLQPPMSATRPPGVSEDVHPGHFGPTRSDPIRPDPIPDSEEIMSSRSPPLVVDGGMQGGGSPDGGTPPSPPTTTPGVLIELGPKGPAKARPPAKGTKLPLPADWIPSETVYEVGQGLGFSRPTVDRELDRLRDHATSTSRRLADWDAAARNWLRKAAEYEQGRRAVANGSSTLQQPAKPGEYRWDSGGEF